MGGTRGALQRRSGPQTACAADAWNQDLGSLRRGWPGPWKGSCCLRGADQAASLQQGVVVKVIRARCGLFPGLFTVPGASSGVARVTLGHLCVAFVSPTWPPSGAAHASKGTRSPVQLLRIAMRPFPSPLPPGRLSRFDRLCH